jgi:hypothetical protein
MVGLGLGQVRQRLLIQAAVAMIATVRAHAAFAAIATSLNRQQLENILIQ